MTSGRVQRIIDRVVDEAIPFRWLKIDDESGEELDDLACMEPIRLLNNPHLLKIVDDAIERIDRQWPRPHKGPVDLQDNGQKSDMAIRVRRSNIKMAFDNVVNYIMVWSKKKGYGTCTGRQIDVSQDGDVDPFQFSDAGYMSDFYYETNDRGFYMDAAEWVAKEFLKRGLITPESVAELVARARAQP
jgi:hypothetical protein